MKDRLFQFFGLTTAASLLAGCAFPDRTITPSLAQTEGAGGSKPTGTCEISPEALTSVMEMQKVLQEALKAPALEVLGIGEEQSAEVLKAPENQETSVMMIDADINGQTAEVGEALVMVVGEGTTRSCTAFSRINWGADAGRFHPDSGNPADFLLQEVRIDEKGQVGVVYGGGAELLISETDGKIEETTAIIEGKVIKVENESKPGLLARVFQAIKIAKATFEGPKVALGEAEASETPTSPAVPTAVVPIETQAEPTVASTDEPTVEPTVPPTDKSEFGQPNVEYTFQQAVDWMKTEGMAKAETLKEDRRIVTGYSAPGWQTRLGVNNEAITSATYGDHGWISDVMVVSKPFLVSPSEPKVKGFWKQLELLGKGKRFLKEVLERGILTDYEKQAPALMQWMVAFDRSGNAIPFMASCGTKYMGGKEVFVFQGKRGAGGGKMTSCGESFFTAKPGDVIDLQLFVRNPKYRGSEAWGLDYKMAILEAWAKVLGQDENFTNLVATLAGNEEKYNDFIQNPRWFDINSISTH